jgi:2-hydroxychromene-2-carboxylate isomerase
MAIEKQRGTTVPARVKQRGSKGPRKKRTRPEPRKYTVADLDRARDRVEAAERRVESEGTNKSHRGRAGLRRAQLELRVIESNLRARGLFTAETPLGRVGQPEDIAKVAVFLASDEAGFITGERVVVSGGRR